MARFRCNTCGGEYDSDAGKGYVYFHACPDDHVVGNGQVVPFTQRRDENIISGSDGRPKAAGRGRAAIAADSSREQPVSGKLTGRKRIRKWATSLTSLLPKLPLP